MVICVGGLMDDFSSVWWNDGWCLVSSCVFLHFPNPIKWTRMTFTIRKKIWYSFWPYTLWSFFSVSPNSLQDECSPTLRDQRGSQLWRGCPGNCQSAGWPRRHSRQNHQQWPEEEKGNWPFGGFLMVFMGQHLSMPWNEVIRLLGLRHWTQNTMWKKKKKSRLVTLKSPLVPEEGEKQSKSQVLWFSGEHKL